MNKRQVTVLWITALVLTALLVIIKMVRSDSYEASTERERGETLLADFPAEKVAEITIARGDDTVTLAQSEGGWTVAERDGYPANVNRIHEFLRTLDQVEVTQGIDADPSFAPRFGMDPQGDEGERPTEAVFSDSDGEELARVTFGKNLEASSPGSPFGGGGGATGRFVRNHADDSGFYVTREVFPTLQPDPADWLDQTFLEIEKIASIAVSEPGQENETAWKLTRPDESADFSLEGQGEEENLDAATVNPLKTLFSFARFEDVVPNDEAAEAWDKSQRRTAVVETVEGFTYHITFGPMRESADGSGDASAYLMRVVATADIPEERKVAEDETEEDAKEKQQAFEDRKKELEQKLEVVEQLEGRTFKVSQSTVNPLLKTRSDLIESETDNNGRTSLPSRGPGPGGIQAPFNPGAPGVPGGQRRSRAVTPPIAIPPREESQPEQPNLSDEPEQPDLPEQPEEPEQSEQSEQSEQPEQPKQPAPPEQPKQPAQSEKPKQPAQPEQPEQSKPSEQQPEQTEQPERTEPSDLPEQPEQPDDE
jgi:hypothetical protein